VIGIPENFQQLLDLNGNRQLRVFIFPTEHQDEYICIPRFGVVWEDGPCSKPDDGLSSPTKLTVV
jgi:hypothetical protein